MRGEANMPKDAHRGLKIFFITLTVSFVVMMCIFLLFFLFGSFGISEPTAQTENNIPAYTAKPEENLNLLLIGCERTELPPSTIMLIRYNAVESSITLIPLDPDTRVVINDQQTTLAAQYDYASIHGCVLAVKNLLSCDVDRYIRINAVGMANLVDYLGGIQYEFTDGITAKGLPFPAGRQLLDGRRVGAIMSDDAPLAVKGNLIKGYIDQHFTSSLDYNKLTSALFYNIETNLNQYDLAFRQKGFFSAIGGELEVTAIPLEAASGIPDASTLELLTSLLNPA